jgi:hypothetical protein
MRLVYLRAPLGSSSPFAAALGPQPLMRRSTPCFHPRKACWSCAEGVCLDIVPCFQFHACFGCRIWIKPQMPDRPSTSVPRPTFRSRLVLRALCVLIMAPTIRPTGGGRKVCQFTLLNYTCVSDLEWHPLLLHLFSGRWLLPRLAL